MSRVVAKSAERKPEQFASGDSRIAVGLEQLDFPRNGKHPYVWVHAESQDLKLTPSTARAVARALLVFADQAEARRKTSSANMDMTSTGQGEISEEKSS